MTASKEAQEAPSSFDTPCGIRIHRSERAERYADGVLPLESSLDRHRGALLTSSFEYPGRYTRWDIGFVNPPLVFTARARRFSFDALNDRGALLLAPIGKALGNLDALAALDVSQNSITGTVRTSDDWFPEELRSKQPTVFSVLRAVCAALRSDDPYLGFYGAFGYELAFQFEPVRLRLTREADERDLVLYLPDEILIVDHRREQATTHRYEFEFDGASTEGLARDGADEPYSPASTVERECDHAAGEYAATVRTAIEAFRRGDLFEVVPGQTFFELCPAPPSEIFARLKKRNPAPYGALINLGEKEYLVAASPEMYVRVDGRRIETCPISGTIARGKNAIGDAAQILKLLNSEKEKSELTMCTDVDRNDKSRVCVAGSVRVIGRRQLELMGVVGFDGNMNTGLTLRTVRIKNGIAEVRAGATLLFESDPDAEEAETRLKASALLDAIRRDDGPVSETPIDVIDRPGVGKKVLMVDHEDSFVHTLAGYFRETGAQVITYRSGFPLEKLAEEAPHLVLLSPGPGRPDDFDLKATIAAALQANLPMFGVCLGLQGIVEYFGGELDILPKPMHGKASTVRVLGGRLLESHPREFDAGRYHSLIAKRDTLPEALTVTAETPQGVVMSIEHVELPVAAVQFHPESILSLEDKIGHRLVDNVLRILARST
jgi:anthranilate synthase